MPPCHHTQDTEIKETRNFKEELQSHPPASVLKDQTNSKDTNPGVKGKDESLKQKEEESLQTLIAELHANLLSVILSDSQSFPRETLIGDHVAVTVAALLGLSNYQPTQLKKSRGKDDDYICDSSR